MLVDKVAVIGAGVMGEGVISSLLKAGFKPNAIFIRDKSLKRVEELENKYGVVPGSLKDIKVAFLAVKPQDLELCMKDVRDELSDDILLVSVLSGTQISRIQKLLSKRSRVVRVMPNTPLLLGEGMSVIAQGDTATVKDAEWVKEQLATSGKVLEIEESLMDAVTATSGSGPAYFFRFIEAITKAAIRLGLSEQDSNLLVNQTFIGAAKMIERSGKDAETLRKEVTSPNGTTAAALASFESSGWDEIVYKAMKAAKDRSEELSN
jgi:pyrroline-5-carboxylate reductase